ncbi:VOC family protein [Eubacteriales bacterium OttesenSCG-928-N13]|nr:VOC family protein [Eubacteriales bacterium OttesenSCG-928-N13]
MEPILGTNVITQVGILVNDIEKTSAEYAKFFGVPQPELFITGVPEEAQTEYLGKPSNARARQAFFKVGPNVDIELIEPDHEPSTWRHDLDQNGEGFHHIAFVVNGMKKYNDVLNVAGMPLLQKGEYPGGRYAYHDANDSLKLILELLEND